MRLMMGLSTLVIAAVALLWFALRPVDAPPTPTVAATGGEPAPNPAPTPAADPPAPPPSEQETAEPPSADAPPPEQPNAAPPAPVTHRLVAPRATPVPRPLAAMPTPRAVPPVPLEPSPTKVAVQNAVRSAKPLVSDCYDQALVQNPSLAGTLKVSFTVMPDDEGVGRIRHAEILGDGMQHPFLEMCVLEALGTAEYPTPEGAEGQLKVTYPFVLNTD